jgi:hypothetical protein
MTREAAVRARTTAVGGRNVYETFRRMLTRGEVPDSIEQLLRESGKSS